MSRKRYTAEQIIAMLRECVTMFAEELPWLSKDDLRLVMGEAVCA